MKDIMNVIYGNKIQPSNVDDVEYLDLVEELTERVRERLLQDEIDETPSSYRIIPQVSNDKPMIVNNIVALVINENGFAIFLDVDGKVAFVTNQYSTIFRCDTEGKPISATGWF